MEKGRDDLIRRILSNRNQLIEIIFIGIVLGIGVDILAGSMPALFRLNDSQVVETVGLGLLFLLLPVIYFTIKIFRERLQSDTITINSFLISDQSDRLKIVEIPRFDLAKQVQKFLAQGADSYNNWLGWSDQGKDNLLTDVLLFYLLYEMEHHLHNFFRPDKTARIRTEISDKLRTNNIFFDVYFPKRVTGKADDHALRLNLLEDSRIQSVNIRDGIEVETDTVRILLEVNRSLSGFQLPAGFTQIYLSRDGNSKIEGSGITFTISIRFKLKAIFAREAWEYYRWFDSFQAELRKHCSSEAFFQDIGWDNTIIAIEGTIKLLKDEFLKVQQELSYLNKQISEGVSKPSQLEEQRLYKLSDERRRYLAIDKLDKWLCKFHEYHGKTNTLCSFRLCGKNFLIPFLSKQEWESRGQPITISIDQDTILQHSTDSSENFKIDLDLILDRKAIGQRIWDAPTLYLDDVLISNEPNIPPIFLIVKTCRYFESATAALKLENETIDAVKSYFSEPESEDRNKRAFENCPIREKYYLDARQKRENLYRPMTLGCMIVFALKADNGYDIIIQTRSSKNATANGVISVAPTFGLSPFLGRRPASKKSIIFHNFLKEYLEELHNQRELTQEFETDKSYDDYLDSIYANELVKPLLNDSFELIYLGFGYNLINGFPNVGLLARQNDLDSGKLLKEKIKTNWEVAASQQIRYVNSTDQAQLVATLETLDPGGAYFLYSALKYLKVHPDPS